MIIKENHPYANIFPMLPESELAELENDIKENGLNNPIIIYQDKILDGRNRYQACLNTGIPAKFKVYDGDDALSFVVSENLHRRHLTPTQRAAIAADMQVIYEQLRVEAKEKQRINALNNQPQNVAKLPHSEKEFNIINSQPTKKEIERSEEFQKQCIENYEREQNKTRTKLAATTGASPRYVQEAQNIKKESPELFNKLKDGSLNIPEAKLLSKETPEKQKEIIKKIEAGEAKTVKAALIQDKKQDTLKQEKKEMIIKPVVYHQDYKEFLNNIDDNSIDFLFTDPPYSTDIENINGFVEDWVPLALSKIKETGRCFICIGAYPKEQQAYFNVLLNQDKFILDNPIIWTYRNTLGITPKMKYNLNYQTILHLYSEKSRPLNTEITNEMFSVMDISAPDGRQGNRFHTWQKPNELATRLIKHAMQKDETMIDCFACTGTFLIQGIKAGLKVFGCDISLDNLKIAEERGCNIITGKQI